ncbi:MAG TPA: NAD(P)-binding domain-containing protein, partial [Candidatus Polarisedimenticolia bacterium]|nr:NAD(P)-binding domain-containing protein [Candidatus Polarisedimenticolia bacterium]
MILGMVGLGRMGGNMARRLMKGGHQVVAWARHADAVKAMEAEGAKGAASLADLVKALPAPRTVWVMVPSGDATEATVRELGGLLARGDTVIDGGNSYFKDDVRRAAML